MGCPRSQRNDIPVCRAPFPKPGQGAYLHVPRSAVEPLDPRGNAADDALDERLLEEVGKPVGRITDWAGGVSATKSSVVLYQCGYNMNDDGQVPLPEAAALDWKFKAGSESPAQAGRGSVWIRSLPRSGAEEARAGQALQGLFLCPSHPAVRILSSTYSTANSMRHGSSARTLRLKAPVSSSGRARRRLHPSGVQLWTSPSLWICRNSNIKVKSS